MGVRLQKAWCSALALPYPDYAHLVEFPENHNCWFTRDDAILRKNDYLGFLFRVRLSEQAGRQGRVMVTETSVLAKSTH